MGKEFSLSIYPWVYIAKYKGREDRWIEEYQEKPHKTHLEEKELSPEELNTLLQKRNSFPDIPLVTYTTQYGMGCFEGLKGFPQADGSVKLFRPDANAKRFYNSMLGLKMPGFPEETFSNAVKEILKRNQKIGFSPKYNPAWEKDNFLSGHSIYIRPFSYSEPAIGLGISSSPWVIIVTTPVGTYFAPGNSKAVTTKRVRAFEGGTGWIKCDSNYVVASLAAKEAEVEGYMEAIFLDAKEHRYIEEGSSCNIFFLLKNGNLVTPDLRDTILPGINRASILTLAQDMNIETEERRISIDEVLSDAEEAFVSGTAAGISFIESITHEGKTSVFCSRKIGDVTNSLLTKLKGIQYGSQEDIHNWMTQV